MGDTRELVLVMGGLRGWWTRWRASVQTNRASARVRKIVAHQRSVEEKEKVERRVFARQEMIEEERIKTMAGGHVKYTDQEDSLLMAGLMEGASVDELAEKLGRSPKGISIRIRRTDMLERVALEKAALEKAATEKAATEQAAKDKDALEAEKAKVQPTTTNPGTDSGASIKDLINDLKTLTDLLSYITEKANRIDTDLKARQEIMRNALSQLQL